MKGWLEGRAMPRSQPWEGGAGALGATRAQYLDVGPLQVVVGHSALEVAAHVLADAVAGRGAAQALALAAAGAARPLEQRSEEGQLGSRAGARGCERAARRAVAGAARADVSQAPVAAQRGFQVTHRTLVVAAVVGSHPAGVEQIVGLQRAALGLGLRLLGAAPQRRGRQQQQQQRHPRALPHPPPDPRGEPPCSVPAPPHLVSEPRSRSTG